MSLNSNHQIDTSFMFIWLHSVVIYSEMNVTVGIMNLNYYVSVYLAIDQLKPRLPMLGN